MISILNFVDSRNHIDWNKYRRAQIAVGEICEKCFDTFPLPREGPSKCSRCLKENE